MPARRPKTPVAVARSSSPSSAPAPLTLRDLNRATLARQLLLAREKTTVPAALARVAGLQAQWPGPPYIGLWTRLAKFSREDLGQLLLDRQVVRATFVRGTLHTLTVEDFLQLRMGVQEMLHRGYMTVANGKGPAFDPYAIAEEARPFLREQPRTQEEVRVWLAARHPKLDFRALGHAVRMHLPLVQVPEAGVGAWDYPTEPKFALAEEWLGRAPAPAPDPKVFVRRYLAAFGPATAADVQTWSGLPAQRAVLDTMRDELVVLKDDRGRELFDLPYAPRPGGDVPAPPRLIPEYDNLLLAHADRTRVVPEPHRAGVFLAGLRIASTFLVDGFVRGSWGFEKKKKTVTLTVTPFASITKKERDALADEAENLLPLLAREGETREVSFAKG